MDTSEAYIKMCDCPEIQEQWNHQESYGDWVSFQYESHEKEVEVDVGEETKLKIEKSSPCHVVWNSPIHGIKSLNGATSDAKMCTWLPRQDQVQGMMSEPNKEQNCLWLLFMLYEYAEGIRNPNEVYPFSSMEQLWLAFYMRKKHQKTWDGEKWVKK